MGSEKNFQALSEKPLSEIKQDRSSQFDDSKNVFSIVEDDQIKVKRQGTSNFNMADLEAKKQSDNEQHEASEIEEPLFNIDMNKHAYKYVPDKMENIDLDVSQVIIQQPKKRKQVKFYESFDQNESLVSVMDTHRLDQIMNRISKSSRAIHSVNLDLITVAWGHSTEIRHRLKEYDLYKRVTVKKSSAKVNEDFTPMVTNLEVDAQHFIENYKNSQGRSSVIQHDQNGKSQLNKDNMDLFVKHYEFTSLKPIIRRRFKKDEQNEEKNTEEKDQEEEPTHHMIDKTIMIETQNTCFKKMELYLPQIAYCVRAFISLFKCTIDDDQDQNIDEEELKYEQELQKLEMTRLKSKYTSTTCSYIKLDNDFRRVCIYIMENPWFDRLIISLIAANSIFLGIIDYTWDKSSGKPKPFGNQLTDRSEIFFTISFTCESVIKIIATGLILEQGSYLRDAWNWLDFTVVITALMTLVFPGTNVSSLRTFRLFRPLKSLAIFPSMRVLVSTLFMSFTQLSNILILDMFFILTFSLFGLQMWGGIVHQRCRTTPNPVNGDWIAVQDDKRLCGAYHQCKQNEYCGSLLEVPPNYTLTIKDLYRDSKIKELNFGITNFDTIQSSYLTIFQCTTTNGWTHIMKIIQDGYSYGVSSFYFIFLVIVCSYFLLNLTVAVMLDNFKQLKAEETQQYLLSYENNRLKLQKLKGLFQYMNDIKREQNDEAEELQDQEENKETKAFFAWLRDTCTAIEDPPDDDRYQFKICSISYQIINFWVFSNFILLLIVLNTLALATDQYPEPSYTGFMATLNKIFTVLFTIECVLKLLGLTTTAFLADAFNIFDLIIVIASLIEMLIQQEGSGAGVISALRGLRLIRLLKLARSNINLKALLDSIMQTVQAVGNFLVLLAIFIYVFALLGMSLFAGAFQIDPKTGYYDPKGVVPRTNFDDIIWAIITVFQIMIGDEWYMVMYLAVQSQGYFMVSYFIILVLFGNFIMLNLFLAILLGNFELASLMTRSKNENEILTQFEKNKLMIDDKMEKELQLDAVKKDKPIDYKGSVKQLELFSQQDDEPFEVEDKKSNETKSLTISDLSDREKEQSSRASPKVPIIEMENLEDKLTTPKNREGGPTKDLLKKMTIQPGTGIGQSPKNNLLKKQTILFSNSKVKIQEENSNEPKKHKDFEFDSSQDLEAFYNEKKEEYQNSRSARNRTSQSPQTYNKNFTLKLGGKHRQSGIFQMSPTKVQEVGQGLEQKTEEDQMDTERNLISDSVDEQEEIDYWDYFQKSLKDLWEYMCESSLFILHKESYIRKFLIKLTLTEKRKKKYEDNILNVLDQEDGESSDSDGFVVGHYEDINAVKKKESHACVHKHYEALHDFNFDDPEVHFGKALYVSESSLLSKAQQERNKKKEEEDKKTKEMHKFILKNNSPNKQSDEFSFKGCRHDHPNQQSSPLKSPTKSVKSGKSLKSQGKHSHNDAHSEQEDSHEHNHSLCVPSLINEFEKKIQSGGTPDELTEIMKVAIGKENKKLQQQQQSGEIDRRALLKEDKILQEKQEKLQRFIDRAEQQIFVKKKFDQFHDVVIQFCPCCNWTMNQWFENFIYLAILGSLLILILESPTEDPNSAFSQTLKFIDGIVSMIFVIETVIRILAQGFWTSSLPGKKGYIVSGRNQIDFFVSIICELIILTTNTPNSRQIFGSLKVLRSLKALRPLRVLTRSESFRIIVDSLYSAFPAIFNGLIVASLVVFIYAIIGISFFKGLFYSCKPIYKTGDPASVLDFNQFENFNKTECKAKGGRWVNRPRNFDSIGQAIPVLCEMITTEGWLEMMYAGIDATALNESPKRNNSPLMALFFISFLILGNVFVLNLFVGIVIDKFNRLKEKILGFHLMTKDQRDWIEQEQQMIKLKLNPLKDEPTEQPYLACHVIQKHRYFDYFISTCIVFSTIVQALFYQGMSEVFKANLSSISLVLTFIYNIEAIIKLTAMGTSYFQDTWNRFDFLIVLIADVAILGEVLFSQATAFIGYLRIIKALRILRILRLIRFNRNLRVLVDSLVVILPSLANVGTLIFLILFIYAVIGVHIFHGVIFQDTINENYNFTGFWNAFILLTSASTGEGWNKFMRELAITNDTEIIRVQKGKLFIERCQPEQNFTQLTNDGPKKCGTPFSYVYFASFVITIHMLMLNLFIAVVIEGFSSTNKEHTGVVTQENYNEFLETWLTYDKDATGWITVKDLIFFMLELEGPLGKKLEFEEYINPDKDEAKEPVSDSKISRTKRFVVNIPKNMFVSLAGAMKLLDQLSLPVYKTSDQSVFRVHISHVLKRTSYLAMKKRKETFSPQDLEIKHFRNLRDRWELMYPDLDDQNMINLVDNYDTGRIWAGQFIALCIKSVVSQRKLNDQEVAKNWKAREKQDEVAKENKDKQNQPITFKVKSGSTKKKLRKRIMKKAIRRLENDNEGDYSNDYDLDDEDESSDEDQGQERVDENDPLEEDDQKQKKKDENMTTAQDLIVKLERQRKEEEERKQKADDEFKDFIGEILMGKRGTKKETAAHDTRIKVSEFSASLGAAFKQIFMPVHTQQNLRPGGQIDDPNRVPDEERSTWWRVNDERSAKMQKYTNQLAIREKIEQIMKRYGYTSIEQLTYDEMKQDIEPIIAQIEAEQEALEDSAINAESDPENQIDLLGDKYLHKYNLPSVVKGKYLRKNLYRETETGENQLTNLQNSSRYHKKTAPKIELVYEDSPESQEKGLETDEEM